MAYSKTITTVSVNASGAHNEIITGGVLAVPGDTMFEKARYLERHDDSLRQFILNEPRGKVISCANLVLASNHPEADAGFIIMESESYPPMSGTNTLSTVTALLETGLLKMTEPVTNIVLEAPGGLVRVTAKCREGKCVSVLFENVPCFVFALDVALSVDGIGKVTVDIAYGGMIYVLVDAKRVGLSIEPQMARDLVEIGERIKEAAARQFSAIHPENPRIHTVNQTLFTEPVKRTQDGLVARNAVIVSPGRIDRSPCGTGTSARLAVMHAREEIALGENFLHESIIGTKFTGRIEREVRVGDRSGIVPSIEGGAWITGYHTHVLDRSDPLPVGYRLTDTWPKDRSQFALGQIESSHA